MKYLPMKYRPIKYLLKQCLTVTRLPISALVALVLVISGLLVSSRTAWAADRPNIVVILADDLGYGDVRCLNPQGKIPTPHLDRLAREGLTLTDAHSGSAVCTPTRYGLLTGRYAWRTRLQQEVLGGLSPRLIEPGRPTIASVLKLVGYTTACVGKWHLGMDWVRTGPVSELSIETPAQVRNVDYTRPIANGPLSVGFDRYFGIAGSLDMVPYAYIRDDRLTANPTEDRAFRMRVDRDTGMTRLGPTAPGFTAEDVLPRLTQEAIEFIRRCAATPDRPFFLYLPLASPHTPIAPNAAWKGRSGLGVYGDFVMETDAAVGELLAVLDQLNLASNTVVMFTSDNGCSPQADFPDLAKHGHNPSYHFRGTKADIYEGGHRVPLFVRWPGVVSAGRVSDQLACLTDLFRTCVELGGGTVPETAGEDSFSLVPVLRGTAARGTPAEAAVPLRQSIVHHSINGSFAIREGDWKLCLCPGSGGWSVPRPGRDDTSSMPPMQLFNLRDDVAEQQNRLTDKPEIVERLLQLLDEQVANGRSTPGPKQMNAVAVDVRKAGRAAHQPIRKKQN